MFFQRREWRRVRTFVSFKRGVVTHLSSPTSAAIRRASTRQSLKTSTERLTAPPSSTCKNLEPPSPLTCKRSHSYGRQLDDILCHFISLEIKTKLPGDEETLVLSMHRNEINPSIFPSSRAKLEKMPSIPEEPEVLESEVERRTMPDFVKPLADVEVIEGKEVVLKCKVAGLPYPTIGWYHNGKRIESSEERKMTQCKGRCQ